MTAAEPRPRLLLLVRHAAAEQTVGVEDHARRLTERGHRDGAELGRWLADEGIVGDLVLCSSATRARQTWAAAAEAGAHAHQVQLRDELYHGGTRGVLECVHAEAEDAQTVVVVGHAPTLPSLAAVLSDGAGASTAQAALTEGFPTCTVAVLRYAGPWADLGPGTCDLAEVFVARG